MRDVEDVEQAAVEAAGEVGCVMAAWLVGYVTCVEKPRVEEAPCGRRYFFEVRRRFFVALDKRRRARGM